MKSGRPNTLMVEHLAFDGVVSRGEHSHGANEFFLATSGCGRHVTALKEFDFKKGTLHFFARGQRHSHFSKNSKTTALSLRFRDEALSDEPVDRQARSRLSFLKYLAYTGNNKLELEPKCLSEVKRLFAKAANEDKERYSGYKCVLKGIALELIVLICRDENLKVDRGGASGCERLADVLEYAETHFAEVVSVKKVAGIACMSRSHFHLKFKEYTGSSFIEYLTRLRISSALKKLGYTDMPIIEIAYSCGYNSLSRFYTAFRSLQGCSPVEYRKRRYESSLRRNSQK